MPVYISILRGINVGGHKLIKMDALRSLYEQLDFTNIKTYIQSGNVIFQSPELPLADLADTISGRIKITFGFEVPVLVIEKSELEDILMKNPFITGKKEDINSLHVTFLSAPPDPEKIAQIATGNYGADQFIIHGRAVYLLCPGPYHATKLSNAFFEKTLQRTATTRNWKTVGELVKMAAEVEEG
jgi:uncharacterized protein (DUF1697 family)